MIGIITKVDNLLRPILLRFPSFVPTLVYSYGRKLFLHQLYKSLPTEKIFISTEHQRQFWGIKFQSNLFNAAGMFKEVLGYELCYRQGAGAFLCGTITPESRKGNIKMGIKHPFIPLHKSKSAINWMGLPNIGIQESLIRVSKIQKKIGCPIGLSISAQPEKPSKVAIPELIDALKLIEKSQVDFIELNESCPNVAHIHSREMIGNIDKGLIDRMELISSKFLRKRNRILPVIVKFSNDTNPNQVDELIELLINLNFDGINFGNTSTNYSSIQKMLNKDDLRNFEFFTKNFGGGVSGYVLKNQSLNLCSKAVQKKNTTSNRSEFVVIRTGGIESAEDIQKSNETGVDLNQWFTGYFEMFSKFGHHCYSKIFELI